MFLRTAPPKPLLAFAFVAASFCAAPSHAEIDAKLMASGQWRDPDTGLIWMRCSIGQKWTGTTCTGKQLELNWQDANDYFQIFNQDGFAGKHNWRLPSIEELMTIRRCSKGWAQKTESRLTIEGRRDVAVTAYETLPNDQAVPSGCADHSTRPTLDRAIFPNTPELPWYWSASPYASYHNSAWYVYFNHGYSNHYSKNLNLYVRAVRAGQ